MDIVSLFGDIARASAPGSFAAIPLPGRRHDFLAKGIDGAPVFLLHDASKPQYSPGVYFKYLTVQYHATCEVQTEGRDLSGQFAVVACDGSMADLHEIFIRCFGAAVEELPIECGTRELNGCVQKLLDLFRLLSQPSSRSVTGLWAELYVIAKSGHVADALRAWHETPADRFDFAWATGRLEVKASAQSVRIHQFALEQLACPEEGHGYIASFLVQPISAGIGVLDLANQIDLEVRDSSILRQKLWSNVAKALGSDFSDKVDKRFDIAYTERSAMVYAMDDIPKPDEPNDPRVIAIRFTADLTTVTSSLTSTAAAALRGMFVR